MNKNQHIQRRVSILMGPVLVWAVVLLALGSVLPGKAGPQRSAQSSLRITTRIGTRLLQRSGGRLEQSFWARRHSVNWGEETRTAPSSARRGILTVWIEPRAVHRADPAPVFRQTSQ